VRAFYGNFGVLVRALAYILAHGGEGLRNATLDAVLNATYIRKGIEADYDIAAQAPSMHECVFSDARQAARGCIPAILPSASSITASILTRQFPDDRARRDDDRAHRIRKQARAGPVHRRAGLHRARVEEDPETVLKPPLDPHQRVDEVRAARKPVVRWRPSLENSGPRY